MKAEGVRRVLVNLKRCTQRQMLGKCSRDCQHCDLLMPCSEVYEGLETAIQVVDFLEKKRKEYQDKKNT